MVTKNRFKSTMITCPKCFSKACVKDGIIKEKQRFKCNQCGYRHTVSHRGLSLDIRRQALQLYLAGLGFRPIGQLLKCSHVTIAQWIHEHGDAIKSMRAPEIKIVKTKALQAYVETKNTTENTVTLVIDMQNKATSLCIPITPKQKK